MAFIKEERKQIILFDLVNKKIGNEDLKNLLQIEFNEIKTLNLKSNKYWWNTAFWTIYNTEIFKQWNFQRASMDDVRTEKRKFLTFSLSTINTKNYFQTRDYFINIIIYLNYEKIISFK